MTAALCLDKRLPKHWHRCDAAGALVHNMNDPRTIAGYGPRFWDADEKAYVMHLTECDPEWAYPSDDDPEIVTLMFAQLANAEEIVRQLRVTIVAMRQGLAAGLTEAEIRQTLAAVMVRAVAGRGETIDPGSFTRSS